GARRRAPARRSRPGAGSRAARRSGPAPPGRRPPRPPPPRGAAAGPGSGGAAVRCRRRWWPLRRLALVGGAGRRQGRHAVRGPLLGAADVGGAAPVGGGDGRGRPVRGRRLLETVDDLVGALAVRGADRALDLLTRDLGEVLDLDVG